MRRHGWLSISTGASGLGDTMDRSVGQCWHYTGCVCRIQTGQSVTYTATNQHIHIHTICLSYVTIYRHVSVDTATVLRLAYKNIDSCTKSPFKPPHVTVNIHSCTKSPIKPPHVTVNIHSAPGGHKMMNCVVGKNSKIWCVCVAA